MSSLEMSERIAFLENELNKYIAENAELKLKLGKAEELIKSSEENTVSKLFLCQSGVLQRNQCKKTNPVLRNIILTMF